MHISAPCWDRRQSIKCRLAPINFAINHCKSTHLLVVFWNTMIVLNHFIMYLCTVFGLLLMEIFRIALYAVIFVCVSGRSFVNIFVGSPTTDGIYSRASWIGFSLNLPNMRFMTKDNLATYRFTSALVFSSDWFAKTDLRTPLVFLVSNFYATILKACLSRYARRGI